jgi:hypothetical protein
MRPLASGGPGGGASESVDLGGLGTGFVAFVAGGGGGCGREALGDAGQAAGRVVAVGSGDAACIVSFCLRLSGR